MHARLLATVVLAGCAAVPLSMTGTTAAAQTPPKGVQQIDLGERLAAGKLKIVNRDVSAVQGTRGAVHMSEKADNGLAWIDGSDFAEGTIEVDVRGRDEFQRSFLGIAFHGKDNTYEAVYLRPFNFRAKEPDRHQHAVQYIAFPEFDWPRLRKEFPEEFENPVDASVSPTDWVPLRVVVRNKTVQIYVGKVTSPTLEVRKLGSLARGMVGLWVGNGSNGDFANLRITTP
jgi:hypothetical protein